MAIENGEISPQRSADRTQNVISKPEMTEQPMSVMERAFIETITGRPVQETAQRSAGQRSHGFIEQLTVDREED